MATHEALYIHVSSLDRFGLVRADLASANMLADEDTLVVDGFDVCGVI